MNVPSKRFLCAVVLLGLGFVLAACGDDDDAGGSAGPADGQSDAGPTDDGDVATDDGPSAPSGDAGALVTIFPVGEELTFPQELVCVAIQGALSATFTDGAGLEMSIDLPVEDWESSTTVDWPPPSLTVRDERDELNWRIFESGPDIGLAADVDASTAVINDFSIDGMRATGSGQMIDTFAVTAAAAGGTEMPTPVPFAFTVECVG